MLEQSQSSNKNQTGLDTNEAEQRTAFIFTIYAITQPSHILQGYFFGENGNRRESIDLKTRFHLKGTWRVLFLTWLDLSFDWKHLLAYTFLCVPLIGLLATSLCTSFSPPKLSLHFQSRWVIDIQFITKNGERQRVTQEQIEKHRCAEFPLLLINFGLILKKK